jgi:hypothetical protein
MNRELLEKPFEKEQIKQRKGNFGDTIDYVEAHAIIQRLNDAFDGQWGFEVLTQENNGNQVMVLGKLTAEGVSKSQFGCSSITTNSKTGEIISLGDDWKASASDSLKKCASLFGIGLHLYGAGKEEQRPGQQEQKGKGMSEKSQPKGGTTITKEQLAHIKELRTKLGWTPENVQQRSKEMFGTDKVETLNPTMATALIAFMQNQNGGGSEY